MTLEKTKGWETKRAKLFKPVLKNMIPSYFTVMGSFLFIYFFFFLKYWSLSVKKIIALIFGCHQKLSSIRRKKTVSLKTGDLFGSIGGKQLPVHGMRP